MRVLKRPLLQAALENLVLDRLLTFSKGVSVSEQIWVLQLVLLELHEANLRLLLRDTSEQICMCLDLGQVVPVVDRASLDVHDVGFGVGEVGQRLIEAFRWIAAQNSVRLRQTFLAILLISASGLNRVLSDAVSRLNCSGRQGHRGTGHVALALPALKRLFVKVQLRVNHFALDTFGEESIFDLINFVTLR